jgi:hypothetical protein
MDWHTTRATPPAFALRNHGSRFGGPLRDGWFRAQERSMGDDSSVESFPKRVSLCTIAFNRYRVYPVSLVF